MRGLKDVKIPTLITFVSYWIFAMPGSWIFGVRLGGGVVVIWYFLAIGLTVSAALLLWRYRVVITRLHTVHNENQTL
jgi:MATE family multidrug resistance protein